MCPHALFSQVQSLNYVVCLTYHVKKVMKENMLPAQMMKRRRETASGGTDWMGVGLKGFHGTPFD